MKTTKNWFIAGALAACLGAVPGLAIAQEGTPSEQGAESEPVQSVEPIRGLEFDGTLKAVDADRQFILVTSAEGEDLLFHYDDGTEVAGQDTVQGLSGETGMLLHIVYRAEGDRAIAERIEPSEPGPNAAPPDPASEDPGA